MSGKDEVADGAVSDAVVKGRLEVANYLLQGTVKKEAGGERDRVDLSNVSKGRRRPSLSPSLSLTAR